MTSKIDPRTERVKALTVIGYSAVQSQKAVSAYFTSSEILPFGFAKQYCCHPLNVNTGEHFWRIQLFLQ